MSIPPEIQAEIVDFEALIKKFRAGEMSPGSFQHCRLQLGIYGQRQEGVQMVRIKVPLGRLTADQIECLADLAETYGHKNAHVTTRQDIQIHYVRLEDTPEIMRRLAAVGLTTREACGNTVRNVTASPSAGVDPEEVFDVTPYAHAFACHFLRNPVCQNLGRKFKVAFDGGGVMTALPMIHDIGLVARIRPLSPPPPPSPLKGEGSSLERRGFAVYVGGGLGSSPRVAKLLHEFLPVDELIPLAECILRVFDRYGERKVRMKARMKFLIEKFGFERFKTLLGEERRELTVEPQWNAYLNHLEDRVESPPVVCAEIPRTAETPDFLSWKKTNVWPQKQAGYSMAEVRLRTGDIKPHELRSLAGILRRYAGGKCRTMVHQNLLIRWVRDEHLPALYQELKGIGLARGDAQTLYDITACPGTDTCRLGIASSTGLARIVEERLYRELNLGSFSKPDELQGAREGPTEAYLGGTPQGGTERATQQIAGFEMSCRIKISGCPNSCGHHHLANIGLSGGGIPTNGHVIPAFQLMLGGTFGRETRIAAPIVQIPSRNVPDAVVRLVRFFAEHRRGEESFNAFYGRLGKDEVLKILGDLLETPAYPQRPDLYVDWEGREEFSLRRGVIGECAGAVVDDVPPKVTDADEPLRMARAYFEHREFESAGLKAYEAIVKAANGLLSGRLVQTFNGVETTHEFENHFVRTGLLPQWKGFHRRVEGLRKRGPDEGVAKEWLDLALRFVGDCRGKET